MKRLTYPIVCGTLLIVVSISASTQQRDVPTTPVAATAEIAGVVLSADQTQTPVRRVVVSVSGTGITGVRSALTDDAGRFSIKKLPAGTFNVTGRKAAYLATASGSPKPGRPGTPIVLAAGQRADVSMTLFKGGVISGTLRDGSGLPVPGVMVAAADVRGIGTPNPPPAESAVTDDRGMYRIYGLMPGEYVVTATPSPGGSGEIGTRSAAAMDALLALLAQKQSRAAGSPPPPPPAPAPSVGYSPIYFPGSALFPEASRIRLGPGEEADASFAVSHVPVASITGTISGDVQNLASVQLSIIPSAPRASGLVGTGGITSKPPNAQGEFSYGNLPPGQYRIVARARRGAIDAAVPVTGVGSSFSGGGRSGVTPVAGGPPPPNVEQLFAVADVEVRGQDVNGVHLGLQPGGAISGKVVFDPASAPVPEDLTTIRVQLSQVGGSYMASSNGTVVGTSLSSVPAVGVRADGSFQILGVGPGQYFLQCQLPASLVPVWKLRAARLDGRDLLDTGIEGPAVQLTGVTMVLSDKKTELAGMLQSGTGQPSSEYYVIAFSTNQADWRVGARRTVSAKPDTSGRFSFADLPAGEYYMAALTDLDPLDWQTTAFLEQVVPAAIKVSVAEGEKKVQDLRIR